MLGLLVATFLLGCPPRSQEATFAGEKWIPTTYDYAGIRVIQTQTPHAPVEIRLVYCGDPSWYTGTGPLMNQLALSTLIRGGTSDLEPEAFSNQVDTEKAGLSYGVGDGYGWIGLSCLEDRIRPAWKLFAACASQPGFDEATFSSEIREITQNSEVWSKLPIHGLAQLVLSKGFGPLPFKTGTVLATEEVAPTAETALQWYRNTLLGKGRLALVVTGPVDAELVADLLLQGLTDLSSLSWEDWEGLQPAPTAPGIHLEKSPEDKEAIALHLPLVDAKGEAYARNAVEEAAFLIFGQLLAERLERLFTDDPQAKRNIRYDLSRGTRPGAWLMLDGIQVMPRAELIMSELRRFYQEGAREGEVLRARRVLLNDQLSALQSNRQRADLWTREIGQGSFQRWGQLVNLIQVVPEKAVIQVGQTALDNLSWFYYGVPSRLDRNSLGRLN